ncbi:ring-hydroxylating oxygenase subunit alpha [Ramlibacter henchirensis]|uniref:Ring-hydroxylating oxygenase subunit alpha n=1 Tax=Ramlibacter henchirensis TaxID=204072 RepID=A0A4Z0BTG3_9BURK|nr:Rieske 2Fe-2S domain-containing protein [Ramlibacter henchirensis]TFZ02553.1 ring-hydroxylating oxygenase subunit alpha [Ramlibacter henchirensis]
MLSREENETLTRTGPGTPMGTLFRSYWLPVLLSEQLPEKDGPQVRVKILGEDLLAFRDAGGRVGLIEPRCPHRGADLYFGRNEEGGIRCAYHGWKFDADGRCLDMPTVPPETARTLCQKASIRSYPTREWGGMVWAYMAQAPAGHEPPPLPQMEFALVPPEHRYVSKKLQECNWAQAAEGGIDTAHFSFLHMPVARSNEEFSERALRAVRGYSAKSMSQDHVRWMREDPRPRYHVRRHAAGLVLGASRQGEPGEHYWRIAQYLMPCHGYTPSAAEGQTYHGQSWVPIDDHSCWIFCYSWNPERPLTAQERASYVTGGAVYPARGADYVPLRNRSNEYLLDRRMQKLENFTGIEGVSEQDAAIQDSQGEIADRTRELLGPTDVAVVHFRRLMLEAAAQVAGGAAAPAADNPQAYLVRGGGTIAPATEDFEAVMRRRFGDELGRVEVDRPEVQSK